MKLARRAFLQFAGAAATAPVFSRVVTAQVYPSRPITLIVSAAAGGPSDVVGRMVAERMRAPLGQPIIIENVGGADGTIGAGRAARARSDGYTIDFGILGNHVLNGAFYSLPYDVLNDFAPISPLVTISNVLFAKKALPAKDLNELIAWLRANSNKASAGITTVGVRLVSTSFQKETGTLFALVPYRGNAPAVQDLSAGQIDLFFGGPNELPLMRAGSIKAYAVTSGARMALAPDIPTFGEMGLPAVFWSAWFGLFAPRARQRKSSPS
jgi:tripartite-type tricarboxylate transporter receptor subunit TctC